MLAPSEALNKARVYLDEVVPDFAALQPKVMKCAGTRLFQVDNHIFCADGGKSESRNGS